MSDAELNALAEDWLAFWLSPQGSPEREAKREATEREWFIVRDEPDRAWLLILEILRRDHSDRILEVLSAGPLEDLLVKHGDKVIDRVEAEARLNPLFAKLLGGVWRNAMAGHTWDRVQKAWDRRGWDGVPED
ncbi:MAG TPA: hypothetical protein VGJ75_14495 [Dongiaceae bacterium]|jgi:hypothetical protein